MGVTRRPHAPHRARRAGLDRHRGGGRRRGGSRPALRSDQLQLEGLEHGPGAVAHAELAESERPLLARHWRARPRTPGALRRAGHPVDQTSCSSKALSTARVRSRTPSLRSEEHTSELQSLMRTSYAVFCLNKKKKQRSTLRVLIRTSILSQ